MLSHMHSYITAVTPVVMSLTRTLAFYFSLKTAQLLVCLYMDS